MRLFVLFDLPKLDTRLPPVLPSSGEISAPRTCTGQERCGAESKVPVLVFVPVRDRWPISAWGNTGTRCEETGDSKRERKCRNRRGRKEDKLHMTHACKSLHAQKHNHTHAQSWVDLRKKQQALSLCQNEGEAMILTVRETGMMLMINSLLRQNRSHTLDTHHTVLRLTAQHNKGDNKCISHLFWNYPVHSFKAIF